MVSNRCIMAVKVELKKLGIHFIVVGLGEIDIMEDLTPELREQLRIGLSSSGLELMDDKRAILIEKIKNIIIEKIHHTADKDLKTNFSDYLSEKLNHDYNYLSNIFSEVKGITIQQFIIEHKIERVKELMMYDKMNLTEISYQLHYSSVAHLSNQFKKVTGFTPTYFKQLKDKGRKPIDEIGNLPTESVNQAAIKSSGKD